MAKKTEVYIALLRGINVGGKNSLPMKDLTAMFEKAGCSHVATYIQSGNVVFKAEAKLALEITSIITRAISRDFKLNVPVIIRSAQELLKIAKNNPFLKKGGTADTAHVAFLMHTALRDRILQLDARRSPGDEFWVMGSEVYLHCPKGFGRTKLTNQYFDSKLGTTSTIRNWKTVLKLLEMTQTASLGSGVCPAAGQTRVFR
jgi:uncharacterized protein (DUF1697 family)